MALGDRLTNFIGKLNPSRVFAVRMIYDGKLSTTFIVAWRVRVSRDGHLVFYSWLNRCEAVIRDGFWITIVRDLTPDDLKEASQ
jgi:hypothetical protein